MLKPERSRANYYRIGAILGCYYYYYYLGKSRTQVLGSGSSHPRGSLRHQVVRRGVQYGKIDMIFDHFSRIFYLRL